MNRAVEAAENLEQPHGVGRAAGAGHGDAPGRESAADPGEFISDGLR